MEEGERAGEGLEGARASHPLETEGVSPRKRNSRFIFANLIFVILVTLAYGWRPDFLYALTIWPIWIWCGLGIGLSLIGCWRRNWQLTVSAVAIWAAIGSAFDSEIRGLMRTLRPAPQYDSVPISVRSINCGGGNLDAAEEAVGADILLLQESPPKAKLEQWVAELNRDVKDREAQYQLIAGLDASILIRGKLEPVVPPKGTTDFVCAKVRLYPHEIDLYVVSLRLAPPFVRFDYWNPECWNAYAARKRLLRQELDQIVSFTESQAPNGLVILGGDFNTPPDPSIQGRLREHFQDSFAESGRGWGASAVNGFPLVRIDQIWFRGPLWTWDAGARTTEHSDHRMAWANFLLKDGVP